MGTTVRSSVGLMRWLDIGCHRGFFSLWLAKAYSRHTGKHDSAACLVDADPRSREWVQALLRYNTHLGFRYIQGAVAPGHVEAITFVVRAGMVSSADADFVRGPAQAVRVQRLSADAVMRSLPPPYDLVKVDIEGSEYTLIEHYATLLEKTRYLLIEWHASGPKLCTTDACKALEHMGFRLVRSLREAATLEVSGSKVTTSVELFERG